MEFSIITVNLNNLRGLKRTVESVLQQSWKEFEYIIIGGGSSDGSEEFIEKQADQLSEVTNCLPPIDDRVEMN